MDDVIPPSPPSQTRSQISKMMLTSNLKCSPLSYQESDSDISTYGSPSQDVKDRLLSQPQEDMSPNISMPSSHQSSVSSGKGNTNGCCDSSPKKGSDWLKSVQWQTPDKKPQVTSLVQPDSTRKSKKFVRGGLAERLQQILLREKSSMAFWSHHNAMNSTGSNGGSSLTVRLLSLEVQCQMRITKCEVISNTDSQGNTSPTTIFVLFTPTISDQLCLVTGSLVKIYPPWQKLTLPHHKDPILLCTYYCRSVDSDCMEDSDTSSQLMASLQPTESDQQLSLSVISPKKKFQPSRLFSSSKFVETIETHIFPLSERWSVVSESFLESVEEHGGHSASKMSVMATVQRIYCRRVADQSSSLAKPFRGQLIPPQSTSSRLQYQWVLLLQDSCKSFCELQLPPTSIEEENWKECLLHGQGKKYNFSGLRVVQRANRIRSPALFSMIDSLWHSTTKGCTDTSCPTDTAIQGTSEDMSSAPSFCYIFTTACDNDNIKQIQCKSDIYNAPSVTSLQDIHMTHSKLNRISIYGRIIYSRPEVLDVDINVEETGVTEVIGHHVYISDSSLQTNSTLNSKQPPSCAVYIHVRSSCFLLDVVRKSLTPGQMVFFQDVCVEQFEDGESQVYADYCTMVSKVTVAETDSQATEGVRVVDENIVKTLKQPSQIILPKLTKDSRQHSLVQVTGAVSGVDETTAFSWPVCDICGNDRLQGGNEDVTELHCSRCNKDVSTPVTRMNLDVFVKSTDNGQSQTPSIKVQLLQDTIEKLLPVSEEPEDGYDMQCIMGKDIGPINCYIVMVSHDMVVMEEINLHKE
ncbi:DNA repair-scaffolding protein-like isoform X2 [Ptychodera flava]|uniref:DNA repair-scaffolding protein-like isoform X2 n=1 Tax=Ptychodera flava TaxID=63121 RepID=UPI00396A8F6D